MVVLIVGSFSLCCKAGMLSRLLAFSLAFFPQAATRLARRSAHLRCAVICPLCTVVSQLCFAMVARACGAKWMAHAALQSRLRNYILHVYEIWCCSLEELVWLRQSSMATVSRAHYLISNSILSNLKVYYCTCNSILLQMQWYTIASAIVYYCKCNSILLQMQ